MHLLKRFGLPVAVTLIAALIAGYLYWRSPPGSSDADVSGAGVAMQEKQGAREPVDAGVPPVDAPRTSLRLHLKPGSAEAATDGEHLTAVLEQMPSVDEAAYEENTLTLSTSGPVNLSDLLKKLESHQAELAENEVPVRGSVRLHAAGMT